MSTLNEITDRARGVAVSAGPAVEAVDHEAGAVRALSFLSEAELLGYCVPRTRGGAASDGLAPDDDVSVRALCAIRYELAYESGLLDVSFVMQGLGSYPLARGGSDALCDEVLPRVVDGSRVAAFALTEPGAGSSLADVTTRAEKRADGGWVLSGHKTFISNAPTAGFYCVLGRTSGETGESDGALSMFYVPRSSRGIEVRPFEVMAPHPIGEVLFHDVTIPEEHLLGEEGQGLELALSTLGRFRTSVAAAACGFARRALDETLRHVKQREQFGRPLSSFQALRFDLAECDLRLEASELLVREAAAAVDRGEEATSAVARAKLHATEAASWIADRAVQLHGGLGVRTGQIVERIFREVRALRIYEGTSEVQKLILAKELLARGPSR